MTGPDNIERRRANMQPKERQRGDDASKPEAQQGEGEQEVVGQPVDMSAASDIPPLHQGQKLDARGMLDTLSQYHNGGALPGEEDLPHVEESEKL